MHSNAAIKLFLIFSWKHANMTNRKCNYMVATIRPMERNGEMAFKHTRDEYKEVAMAELDGLLIICVEILCILASSFVYNHTS